MINNFNSDGLLQPQIEHTCKLIDSINVNGIALDASGTGSGKTFCASALIRHLKTKFIVICPKLNRPKWKMVLEQFGQKAELIINYEKLARGNLTTVYKYKVKNQKGIPHFLRGEFKIPKDWLVILDESHRTKGIESLNSGLLFALKNQGYKVLCCSATQAMSPMDMRAFGYAAGLHNGMTTFAADNFGMRAFKQFNRDCGAKDVGKWGAQYFDSSDSESVEKLKVMRTDLFDVKKIASRMNREDFGDIFPTNQIECMGYDMGENGKKIQRVYEDMEAELDQLEARCENYREHIFAVLMKARRLAELLKVPSLTEMTEDLIEEGKSVIIFVNFTDTIEALYSRLSKTYGAELVGRIYGGQTIKQRISDINDFQTDKKRIMIANLAAGAEAIDLQDITGMYPRAALVNPSYRAIAVVQSIGRHDRAYAKSDCLTRLVLADGTIETSVADKFNSKKDHLDILNDGDCIPDGKYFQIGVGRDI